MRVDGGLPGTLLRARQSGPTRCCEAESRRSGHATVKREPEHSCEDRAVSEVCTGMLGEMARLLMKATQTKEKQSQNIREK